MKACPVSLAFAKNEVESTAGFNPGLRLALEVRHRSAANIRAKTNRTPQTDAFDATAIVEGEKFLARRRCRAAQRREESTHTHGDVGLNLLWLESGCRQGAAVSRQCQGAIKIPDICAGIQTWKTLEVEVGQDTEVRLELDEIHQIAAGPYTVGALFMSTAGEIPSNIRVNFKLLSQCGLS